MEFPRNTNEFTRAISLWHGVLPEVKTGGDLSARGTPGKACGVIARVVGCDTIRQSP